MEKQKAPVKVIMKFKKKAQMHSLLLSSPTQLKKQLYKTICMYYWDYNI